MSTKDIIEANRQDPALAALEAEARAALAGTNASTEETVQTQDAPSEVSAQPEVKAPEEEAKVETSVPDDKERTKKLYKALGKKDKYIEELEAKIAEKSSSYEGDSLELIDALVQKRLLEHELSRGIDQDRDDFIKEAKPSAKEVAAIEEIRSVHPTLSWEAAHKLYLSYSPRTIEEPKQTPKLGIAGNAAPVNTTVDPEKEAEMKAREAFKAMFS